MRRWLSRQFETVWVRWLVIFTLGVLVGTAAAERVRGKVRAMEVATEVKAATETLWQENTDLVNLLQETQAKLQEYETGKASGRSTKTAVIGPEVRPMPTPAPVPATVPDRAG
jgi:hypothetical protein